MRNYLNLKERPLITGLIIIAITAIIGAAIGIVGLPMILIVSFLVFYLIWAPHGIFAFFLEEGYAKIIMKGDSFHKVYVKYKGKEVLSSYDIVDGTEKEPFNLFGMVFILWPFYRVYTYNQKWVKFKDGVREKREEILSHVILMPYVYGVEVKDAETSGKVPTDMEIAIEAKIVNPYYAMFRIKDWHAAMSSWVEGATRDFVSQNTYEGLIKGELAEKLQKHILNKVSALLKPYGVEITNLSVIQVSPSNYEYEKATQQAVIEKRKKESAIIRAQANAESEAIARMGSAIRMVALNTGKTVDELNKELSKNPGVLQTKYKEEFKDALNLVEKNMSIEGKAYFEMKFPGGNSSGNGDFGNMMAAIIAANKILEQQKGGSSSPSTKEEKIYNEQEIEDLIAWGRKQKK